MDPEITEAPRNYEHASLQASQRPLVDATAEPAVWG